jgi:pseudouridine-5'-phosphate glycosidase
MKLHFSRELEGALARGGPIVALESSVIAQGLPFPQNWESIQACEAAIRKSGSIPAMVAVIDGEIWIGLSSQQALRLARKDEPLQKIASRDLAVALASKATGGTTVSATCEVAAAAGIRVFATGGIGGVHQDIANQLDLSQDLWALSRFPVAVVCAGAKSVLDLAKTLEALVIGVGTLEFPAFYSLESGLRLEHSVADPGSAARLLRMRVDLGQGGIVFCIPPPAELALPRQEIEAITTSALALAQARQIRGKQLTPFLLAEIGDRTGGRSLKVNLGLLSRNAEFAGRLAAAYAQP